MKLSYSIPGKIWWIQDFLDKEVYKGIHNAIIRERKSLNLKDVKSAWNSFLYQNIGWLLIFLDVIHACLN